MLKYRDFKTVQVCLKKYSKNVLLKTMFSILTITTQPKISNNPVSCITCKYTKMLL